MPWVYSIKSGDMHDPQWQFFGNGYSGFGGFRNDPTKTTVPHLGPLPVAAYSIGAAHPHALLGPVVMDLDPAPYSQLFGRTVFRIHGDSSEHPGEASRGCIILPRPLREKIAASLDRQLLVIPGTF